MGELTPPIPDRAGTLRPISLRKANDTEVKRFAQDDHDQERPGAGTADA